MGKFQYLLWALVAVWCLGAPLRADTKVFEGMVPGSGASIQFAGMEPGKTYYLVAKGVTDFGTWWKNGKTLLNDPCYEFNAHISETGGPASLPVFKNSWSISVCDGTYHSDHVYKSGQFEATGQLISFNIYDTDYRDNTGGMTVQIWEVSSDDSALGQQQGTPSQQAHQGSGKGFYVVSRMYWPDFSKLTQIPEDHPNPRYYIKNMDPNTFELQPADDYSVIFVDESTGLEASLFGKGYRFALPIKGTFEAAAENKTANIEGYFLMEVEKILMTRDAVLQEYPEAVKDENSILDLAGRGGVGEESQEQDGLKTSMKVGPIEEGWSDEAKVGSALVIYDMVAFLGCFIANAVYENPLADALDTFREFRDKVLSHSEAGRALIQYYYRVGPQWAGTVKEHPVLQGAFRVFLDGLAWTFEMLDLDQPGTQRGLQWVVEGLHWLLSPWMQEEPVQPPTQYEPIPVK